jgi:hypothetical protein
MNEENLISKAFEISGVKAIASACGVTEQAIYKWQRAGRLPRTELTGETDHATNIATATKRRISRRALIEWTTRGWLGRRQNGGQ